MRELYLDEAWKLVQKGYSARLLSRLQIGIGSPSSNVSTKSTITGPTYLLASTVYTEPSLMQWSSDPKSKTTGHPTHIHHIKVVMTCTGFRHKTGM